MRLLPHREIEIESVTPAAELATRLAGHVEPVRWLRRPWSDYALFEGEIAGFKFRIRRTTAFTRNSFRPVVEGEVRDSPKGSVLVARMRLDKFTRGFLTLCTGWLLLMLVLIGVRGKFVDVLLAAPIVASFAAAVLGFTRFAFKAEARRAESLLRSIASDGL